MPLVRDDAPLLVRVLAGNPVTSVAILACLNTIDANRLRRLHPVVAVVVADVPWCDTSNRVVDTVRWRDAFPAAVGAIMSYNPTGGSLASRGLAALAGVTHLNMRGCWCVTDELLLRLPASLRELNVSGCCETLTQHASFAHLTSLTTLDCSSTPVVRDGGAGLPPSLQELDISHAYLPDGTSLAHLARLRVLRAHRIDEVTLESLPPSLQELHAPYGLAEKKKNKQV